MASSDVRGLLDSIGDLTGEVRSLRTEVLGLRQDLSYRPTARNVTFWRRLSVVLVLVLVLVSIQTVDLHAEACGPGHRSEAIVDELVAGHLHSREDLNRVAAEHEPSGWCGFTFPTHVHDHKSWPRKQHLAGMAMYAIIVALGAWWVLAARHIPESEPSGPDDEQDKEARPWT